MKKLIINFDGTGNEPGDAEEKKKDGVAKDENISNILKIHLFAGGNIENSAVSFEDQMSFYYPGVGVRGNIFKRLWRSAFAAKAPEVIMEEAMNDLERIYKKNDRLYIFGFSRGAAIARLFASRLAKNGLQTATGIIDKNPVISFLGVFDTVAAFGKPNLNKNTRPVSDVVFENGTISPIIRNAYHLVAIDENRLAFRPTLMNNESRVNEIWFPGVHSDVGGGYNRDGLSDNTLSYMLKKAKLFGLNFYEKAENIPKENLKGKDHQNKDITIEVSDIEINPNIKEDIHYHTEKWRNLINSMAPRDATIIKDNIPCNIPYKVHISARKKIKTVPGYDPVVLMDELYEFID
ncbi:MAG: DUF2235 domain-containing protein [Desulfobacula sp.]|uniref:phospholipase effector Tle1 domain-containing protein n=1 Tax=Desulfobacula sp. TaxID=2593537 RepID=UPI0025BBFD3F|nr:DUF2235 domain-containing protein [Desulfobacula sp.]MCD4721939.1 DUF2235 domain-containing protein [Desulfobacula sp.]